MDTQEHYSEPGLKLMQPLCAPHNLTFHHTPIAISSPLLQWHAVPKESSQLFCNMVKGGRAEGGDEME